MDISIIIPVYNAEQYLRECLDSALAQTVKEKEIICIDDGSTDSSYLILQEYQGDYKQIRVLRQENSGPGKARNVGLENAKGEYVCFLDADDYYMDETALEQMIEACRIHKVKVCGSFRKIKKDNDQLELFELHREICKGKSEGIQIDYIDYQDDYHYQNYIFKLSMIKKHNICFPDYRRYQDPPFFLKVMLEAKTMWVLPIELYCLRLGHQNFEQYGRMIKYTLMGIRDNMDLAYKNNLCILQKKLLSRINNDFYPYIVTYFDYTIVSLLMDIKKSIIKKEEEQINYLNEICNYYQLKLSYDKLDGSYNELCLSYYIMRMIIETRYKGISIEKYLLRKRVKTIAIYGLGTFGSALYSELKASRITVLYGIDKSKKYMENLPVTSDIKEIKECDMVIVTPLKEGNEISKKLKESISIPVYTLIEILNEIENICE